jgi:hypothetical protein
VVPSALRTLSVVTLLSAVSGSVFLVTEHQAGSPPASLDGATVLTTTALRPASALDTAAAVPSFAPSVELAAYQVDLSRPALRRSVAEQEAAAARRARAEHKAGLARQKAERKAAAQRRAAAAQRRAATAKARASRDAQRDPKALARILLADRGWGAGQFSCLNSLWNKESRWNYRASNPSSGAYGIPQALPGSKMAGVAADWRTNPATQIRWGLNYIADRYGSPCGAWGHSQASGWY